MPKTELILDKEIDNPLSKLKETVMQSKIPDIQKFLPSPTNVDMDLNIEKACEQAIKNKSHDDEKNKHDMDLMKAQELEKAKEMEKERQLLREKEMWAAKEKERINSFQAQVRPPNIMPTMGNRPQPMTQMMMPKMVNEMPNYHFQSGYMMQQQPAKRPEMMYPTGYCMPQQMPQYAPEQFPYYPVNPGYSQMQMQQQYYAPQPQYMMQPPPQVLL